MAPLLLLLGALHLVGLAVVFISMLKAPLGYEDQRGFHTRTPAAR